MATCYNFIRSSSLLEQVPELMDTIVIIAGIGLLSAATMVYI